MKKLTTMFAGAATALMLSVGASAAMEMGEWDTDGTAGISSEEFRTGFDGMGVYDRWDADKNGQLTEDEFNAGIGDERREAFNTRFTEGAYGEWDGDDNGYLTEDEFGEGVYGGYDDDDDDVIEEPEFGDAGDDMGDGGLFDV